MTDAERFALLGVLLVGEPTIDVGLWQ